MLKYSRYVILLLMHFYKIASILSTYRKFQIEILNNLIVDPINVLWTDANPP